jgi:large subunit ribosomal protein L10
MNRNDKIQFLQGYGPKILEASMAFFVNYKGLNVGQLTELRRQVRAVSGELKVAKNTLLHRIYTGKSLEAIQDFLEGPNAIVICYSDPVSVAKTLVAFAKEVESLVIKGGIEGARKLNPKQIEELSKLPSREVLLGVLMGLLNAPAVGLVTVLGGVLGKFLGILVGLQQKKEQQAA